ncbi:hypothetical protein OQJ18_11995 [Fluoribacter dumoffii]|uniref:hypothetical protein n=1 Tax=Fluoribacter dumoffii TaxID=463 RepID=UPI0022443093|nr:hypothetical protein [Fluoribacter dumoffii]MCW8417185.1 hypothetical protein [Fluoribacter dumoffii]MCW8454975.1 hypothetical protein [Fluoribacter dumoffii]MCW8460948.1 hypothetical protein [Fluoribacter dumoffii]MCW8484390.1 hypothetical protein [Fluoribacter dumoffii]
MRVELYLLAKKFRQRQACRVIYEPSKNRTQDAVLKCILPQLDSGCGNSSQRLHAATGSRHP